jgi:hypothetical protein
LPKLAVLLLIGIPVATTKLAHLVNDRFIGQGVVNYLATHVPSGIFRYDLDAMFRQKLSGHGNVFLGDVEACRVIEGGASEDLCLQVFFFTS